MRKYVAKSLYPRLDNPGSGEGADVQMLINEFIVKKMKILSKTAAMVHMYIAIIISIYLYMADDL